MFQRIFHEGWTQAIPAISFIIMFSVFLLATIRAVRLKPEERNHLASLPLDDHQSDR